MVKKIHGKKDLNLLTTGQRSKMPRGRLTKTDMEAKVFKIYNELDDETCPQEYKGLAKRYLWKVMDTIKEYSQ